MYRVLCMHGCCRCSRPFLDLTGIRCTDRPPAVGTVCREPQVESRYAEARGFFAFFVGAGALSCRRVTVIVQV